MGNVGSIYNMLKYIGEEAIVTFNISDIEKAEKIILPGVGAFDKGIENLRKLDLIDILNKWDVVSVKKGKYRAVLISLSSTGCVRTNF